ncbi:MAG: tRNA uracil 4-sulfurtransferase ThiI [Verrucomicrobiota bacterium]|nr:tRNA uracil 4-sulfurtransferase ThiI [Verrucomicrobiota bacterium]
MIDLKYNAVILRYHEIGLKKKNRHFFEGMFIRNIKDRLLQEIEYLTFYRERGRIILHLPDFKAFDDSEKELIHKSLPDVFGLESFSFAFWIKPEMHAIDKTVMETFPKIYETLIKQTDDLLTYRMRVRKSINNFPVSSQKIEISFAEKILDKYPRLKLNLNEAELSIGVEIRSKMALIFYRIYRGPGGLPVGTSQPILALLSGGIDSPVACYMAMKRGCTVDYLTFHSDPYTPPETLEKIADITRILGRYQRQRCFIACNLSEAQKAVRDNCSERYRTILYRRIMMRIASKIAEERGKYCLLTGESLGQVASQTIENLTVINDAADRLILRPLICFDKLDAIAVSEKIGTFEVSKRQVPDSCTVFAPTAPATRATLKQILAEEKKLDMDKLVKLSLDTTEIIDSRKVNL